MEEILSSIRLKRKKSSESILLVSQQPITATAASTPGFLPLEDNALNFLDDVTAIWVRHPHPFTFDYVLDCIPRDAGVAMRYKLKRYRTGFWNSYEIQGHHGEILGKFELTPQSPRAKVAPFNSVRRIECPVGKLIATALTRPSMLNKTSTDLYQAFRVQDDSSEIPAPHFSQRTDIFTTTFNIHNDANRKIANAKMMPLCSCLKTNVVCITFTKHTTNMDKLVLIDFATVCAENSMSSPCTWITLGILALISLIVVGVTVGIMHVAN